MRVSTFGAVLLAVAMSVAPAAAFVPGRDQAATLRIERVHTSSKSLARNGACWDGAQVHRRWKKKKAYCRKKNLRG